MYTSDYPSLGSLHRLMAYWVLTGSLIAIVWLTRISLVCSLIRIIPPSNSLRPMSYIVMVISALTGIAIFIQRILLCHQDHGWQALPHPQCTSEHLAIMATEISLELFCDIITVALFLRAIIVLETETLNCWSLVVGSFFGALLMASGSIAHAVFLIPNTGILEPFTATVQAFSSLIATNFPAFIVFFSLLQHSRIDDLDKAREQEQKFYAQYKTVRLGNPFSFKDIGSPAKLRAFSPTSRRTSSFFSPQHPPDSVRCISPLPSPAPMTAAIKKPLRAVKRFSDAPSIKEPQPDAEEQYLTGFFEEEQQQVDRLRGRLRRPETSNFSNRMSPALCSSVDDDTLRISSFFRDISPSPDSPRIPPSIASTVDTDELSLSAYSILINSPTFGIHSVSFRGPLSSFCLGGNSALSEEITSLASSGSPTGPIARSLIKSPVSSTSAYSTSCYSQADSRGDFESGEVCFPRMPGPTYPMQPSSGNRCRSPFQLPVGILAAMQQKEIARHLSRPTPF
ncbi:hypothetical protein D9757_007034 [Collybiopsis confluens]|uniref:Rhodopsin domain-containing protein n=1 Tax=Collybiopsis confluens TaxID=2823264 RepID=A0A8H5HCK3_9AGAR|nr:hypothetical protein D9757_007034 [Collybiopsis confluens]